MSRSSRKRGSVSIARVGALAAAVAVTLLVAACSPATSPQSSAGTSIPAASPSAEASTAPGSPAAGSPAPSVSAQPSGPVELTVFAAASMHDAFTELATTFESLNPGVKIALSFGASSALRAQIEAGARVDLFASADRKNPKKLVEEGLTAGPPAVFAANELAVIVPAANPGKLFDAYDMSRPGVRVIAAGADVPITGYTQQLFANLEAYHGALADFIPAIERNTVSHEADVRSVLAKIELGEGDVAVVYATDALSAGHKVKVLALPPGTNVRANYAAVVPKDASNAAEGAELLAWLQGPQARAILARYGFLPPA